MNAQKAYEYLNAGNTDLKGLVEALTGEPEKVDEPVKVGDRVRFSHHRIKDGIGEVCHVFWDDSINVGFDAEIQGYGWVWEDKKSGFEHAKKRGFKYSWPVDKGHYTIIGKA